MAAYTEECEFEESAINQELGLLQAIYIHELDIQTDSSGHPAVLSLTLHPSTADNVELQYVCLTLVFSLTQEYPDVVPHIAIKNPRGISDEQLTSLSNELHQLAAEQKGSAMLYELIEVAKEALTHNNTPHGQCVICLEDFMEGEAFTKTACYHHYHCDCLARYIQHALDNKEEEKEDSKEEKDKDKDEVVCGVCREPITYDLEQLNSAPKHHTMPIKYKADREMQQLQKKMARLYEKQKQQGGIIDVEAESNKFLIDISVTPTLPMSTVIGSSSSDIEQTRKSRTSVASARPQRDSKTDTDHKSDRYNDRKSQPRQYHSEKRAEAGKRRPGSSYDNRQRDARDRPRGDSRPEPSARGGDGTRSVTSGRYGNDRQYYRNNRNNRREGYAEKNRSDENVKERSGDSRRSGDEVKSVNNKSGSDSAISSASSLNSDGGKVVNDENTGPAAREKSGNDGDEKKQGCRNTENDGLPREDKRVRNNRRDRCENINSSSRDKHNRGQDRRGQDSERRGQDSDRRGQDSDRRGQDSDRRGQDSDRRGQDSDRRGQGSDRRGQDSDRRGQDSDRRGQDSDRRGQDSDRRGQESDRRGQGSDRRGQDSERRGQESDRRGQESDRRGQDSDRRGQDSVRRGQDSDRQGQDSDRRGQGSDRRGQDSDRRGHNSDRRGQADRRGQDSDRRGRYSDRRGQDSDGRGQDSDGRGQGSDIKGQDSDRRGQDSGRRGQVDRRGQDSDRRGQNSDRRGQADRRGQDSGRRGQDSDRRVQDSDRGGQDSDRRGQGSVRRGWGSDRNGQGQDSKSQSFDTREQGQNRRGQGSSRRVQNSDRKLPDRHESSKEKNSMIENDAKDSKQHDLGPGQSKNLAGETATDNTPNSINDESSDTVKKERQSHEDQRQDNQQRLEHEKPRYSGEENNRTKQYNNSERRNHARTVGDGEKKSSEGGTSDIKHNAIIRDDSHHPQIRPVSQDVTLGNKRVGRGRGQNSWNQRNSNQPRNQTDVDKMSRNGETKPSSTTVTLGNLVSPSNPIGNSSSSAIDISSRAEYVKKKANLPAATLKPKPPPGFGDFR